MDSDSYGESSQSHAGVRRSSRARYPWVALVVLCLFILGVAAGCGGDDDDDESGEAGDQSVSATANSPADCEPEVRDITIAYGFIDVTSLPQKFAQDQGLYEKYGLDVKLEQVASDGQAAQSLATGSADAMSVGSAILPATERAGNPAVMVAPTQSTAYDMLVGSSDISDPQELAGKKVAIGVFGDDTHNSVVLALDELGVSAEDITLIQAGNEPERLAALRSGSVDAAPIDQSLKPTITKEGFNPLVELSEADVRVPRHGLAVSQEFIDDNPCATQALVGAYFEALQMMFEDTDAAIESYADWAQLDENEARESFDVVLPLMEENNQRCMLQEAEWWERLSEALGEIEVDLGEIDTEPLWTTEFVDRLIEGGFARKVGAPC